MPFGFIAGAFLIGALFSKDTELEKLKKKYKEEFKKYNHYKSILQNKINEYNKLVEDIDKEKEQWLNDILKYTCTDNSNINIIDQDGKVVFNHNNTSAGSLNNSSSVTGSLITGGILTGTTYTLVSIFGTASTGTAIVTLSGAAATNATFAAIGGGSLAAGGLGIAGGHLVLGSLFVLPFILSLFDDGGKKDKIKKEIIKVKKTTEQIIKEIPVLKMKVEKKQVFLNMISSTREKYIKQMENGVEDVHGTTESFVSLLKHYVEQFDR